MRLIDAEELKHRVNNSKYYGTERQRDFCDMIAESETIDAVEVVRCRDCKHSKNNNGAPWICAHPNNNAWSITADHYCGFGERREKSEVEE